MTSFINIIDGDVAEESILQGTAFCYLFLCGQKELAVHVEINPLYGGKCFMKPAIRV